MSTPSGGETDFLRAPATTGVVLVNGEGTPVYFNWEAIAVLTYPKRARDYEKIVDVLAPEIRALLRRLQHGDVASCSTGCTSGRRHYACHACILNPGTGERSAEMIALVLERETRKAANLHEAAEQFHLTQREQETVELLTLGLTSKEIATRMNISTNTVKTFFHLVMTKMGVNTRAGIVGKIVRL